MADIDVEKVLSELTLEEKVSLTAGQSPQLLHLWEGTQIERSPEYTLLCLPLHINLALFINCEDVAASYWKSSTFKGTCSPLFLVA